MARKPGLTRAQVGEIYGSGLREALIDLTHQGLPAVQGALSDTLQRGAQASPSEAEIHRKFIRESFPDRKIGQPSWLSQEGLMAVTYELSSPQFWGKLFQPGLLPDDIREKVEVRFDSEQKTALLVSATNAYYMSSTIYASLLAVAEGESVRKRRIQSRISPLVQELSDRFPNPVKNPEELITRMQEIVPNPDKPTTSQEPTLIDYFKDYKVFKTITAKGVSVCPAIPFTEVLMQQWGRMFDDLIYRTRFADLVQKSEENNGAVVWSGKKKKRKR